MSWDISVRADDVIVHTAILYERNVTWNDAAIFHKALGMPFRALQAMRGREALPLITQALANLEQHRSDYLALEPDNGWGGIDDVVDVLSHLRMACQQRGDSRIFID